MLILDLGPGEWVGFAAPRESTEGVPPAVKRQRKDWSKLADEAIKQPAEGDDTVRYLSALSSLDDVGLTRNGCAVVIRGACRVRRVGTRQ